LTKPKKSVSGKKLSEDTHSKSIEGFSARDRYVRLTLVNKLQRFTLTQVAGVYQEKSAVPMVIHEVPLTEDQEVRAKKAGRLCVSRCCALGDLATSDCYRTRPS
jgi:hypothetical protein